jgi:hypothetical protein
VGRSRSAEAVKKNRTKKEKFFCKKVLTAADFHVKAPPTPIVKVDDRLDHFLNPVKDFFWIF